MAATRKAKAKPKPRARTRTTRPAAAAKRSLATRLTEVQAEITEIPKDARNEYDEYDYSSVEAIYRAIRGPLAKAGIAFLPGLAEVTVETANSGTNVTAAFLITLEVGETGEQRQILWTGIGRDANRSGGSPDKALGKAYTQGLKTFWRQTLLLPQGETEPEHAADEPSTPAPEGDRISAASVARLLDVAERAGVLEGDDGKRELKLKLGAMGVAETSSVNRAFAALTPAQALDLETWLAERGEAGEQRTIETGDADA